MNRKLFSIIIPTYNSDKTLAACLDSVYGQELTSFEVVVVDGGSKDNTISIIKSYHGAHGNLRWLSEEDNGIYDAMNKAVKLAMGEWFYFLGSDDRLYSPAVLAEVASEFNRNPASKFLYGDIITSEGSLQKFEGFTFDRLIHFNIGHQAIFYHRSLFDNHTYDTSFRLLADWDLNLKVFKPQNHPVYINKVIAYYNLTGASENWTEGPEYKKNFSNRKMLYKKYDSLYGYYRFKTRRFVQLLKQRLKPLLTSCLLA